MQQHIAPSGKVFVPLSNSAMELRCASEFEPSIMALSKGKKAVILLIVPIYANLPWKTASFSRKEADNGKRRNWHGRIKHCDRR